MLFLIEWEWCGDIAGFDAKWLIVFWNGPICFCPLRAQGIAGMIADGAIWAFRFFGERVRTAD